MFPETMPTQWFADIYDLRFKVYNVLQRRKRMEHESTLSREMHHDFHPHDLEHDGEAHFSKLIARESAITELTMGRLMGSYILFSDEYIPVQTGTAFYKAIQSDGGKGTFYSLGADVHCLFYKPVSGAETSPEKAVNSLIDHLAVKGMKMNP